MSSPFRSTDPTTFNQVDGIIINESAPPASVQGVAANIAVLVGRFQRGPVNEVRSVGSIGEFHEIFGKSSFSGNKEIANKRFGSLRIVRAIASDAAKATLTVDDAEAADALTFEALYAGAYGNDIQVKIEQATGNAKEVTSVTCVGGADLDGKTLILQDKDGSVGFWFDVAGGTTIPAAASACDRAVEITTVVSGDTAAQVATKTAVAINADAEFVVPAPSAAIILVTDAEYGARDAASASTSGFTVAQSVAGVDNGRKYSIRDTSTDAVLSEETYDQVKVVGKTQDELSEIFAGSKLVAVVSETATAEPAELAYTDLATGAEGTIADTDYEDAIAACAVEGAGNVLWTDKYSATIKSYLKLHVAANPDKMVVLAPDSASVSKSAAIAEVATYRDTEGRIIYAFNPPKTIINGVEVESSPAGWMASIISNTAPSIDPAFSDNAQFMAGATGLKYALSRQDYIDLLQAGISAFENDADIGIKPRSGVVTQIANSSKTQILRRRMADFYGNSIAFFLKVYQNAPNTAANRRDVKSSILAFDDGLIRDGILPSDAEVSTGLARLIDTEVLNTDLSIGQGFFKILAKRRIYSSMRFIVLQIQIGETVVVTEGEA